jgi:hypothetical protein
MDGLGCFRWARPRPSRISNQEKFLTAEGTKGSQSAQGSNGSD